MFERALLSAASLLLLASAAQALQGPDVVTFRIGERITGSEDIVHFAAANGREAYSFVTVACNIGDQTLLWEGGGSPRHPVIAQNMFRLKDGRFEQLGQSFLKHGFCAISESGCGACQPTPCATLGIGCADTYSASTNDGQGGGRKSEVRPAHGDHTHPFTGAQGSDPNRGRLQVYTSDVDPAVAGNAQAAYFIEGHYITEDDHQYGHAANNATWRMVGVDTSANLSILSGHDCFIEPAIYAWRSEDPGVLVVEVPFLDEGGPGAHGYYYVASRAIDQGDGTWVYSFAMQNLCSDAAGYSFAVPAAAGVTLTDAWFSAPEWHSEEVYDNTPWSFAHAGGYARWSCAHTHAQDPDANALRWGTLMSFGFTADAPPVGGTAELALFSHGGVLLANAFAPGVGASYGCPGDDPLEENDDCVSALPLGQGTFDALVVHGAGGTVDWDYYALELADTGTLDAELRFPHAAGDLDLYLYEASSPACGTGAGWLASSASLSDDEQLSWQNTSGAAQSLVLEVRTQGGVTCTSYALTTLLSDIDPCSNIVDDPLEDNDTCLTALAIAPVSLTGLRVIGVGCGSDDDYYSFVVPADHTARVELAFSDDLGDIDVELFDVGGGCPGTSVATATTATDDELLEWTNASGVDTTCVLHVYGWSGSSFMFNDYDLTLTLLAPQPDNCSLPDDAFEENDSCASPVVVLPGSYAGLRLDATDDDYFTTVVGPGERIDVDLSFLDEEADIDLYFFDANEPSCGDPASTAFLDRSWTATDDEECDWINLTGSPVEVVTFVYFYGAGSEDCVFYDMQVGLAGLMLGSRFCAGDASCPCGNTPAPGSYAGCLNGSGAGAFLTASGEARVGADTLTLTVRGATPSEFGIFVQNSTALAPTPFYNGLLCLPADSHLVRHYSPPAVQPTLTDAVGGGTNAQALSAGDFLGDTQPGATLHYQFWYRDSAGYGLGCAAGANLSGGISITWWL